MYLLQISKYAECKNALQNKRSSFVIRKDAILPYIAFDYMYNVDFEFVSVVAIYVLFIPKGSAESI